MAIITVLPNGFIHAGNQKRSQESLEAFNVYLLSNFLMRKGVIQGADAFGEIRVGDADDDGIFIDALVDEADIDVIVAEDLEDLGRRADLPDHVIADNGHEGEVLILVDPDDARDFL